MKTILKSIVMAFAIFAVLVTVNCKNDTREVSIVGDYESVGDTDNQKITYHITHIKDNVYGIKVDASFEGTETQTDYLEGSYNPEERILSTKRSNVVLNYQFSSDYNTVNLIGEENDMALERIN